MSSDPRTARVSVTASPARFICEVAPGKLCIQLAIAAHKANILLNYLPTHARSSYLTPCDVLNGGEAG